MDKRHRGKPNSFKIHCGVCEETTKPQFTRYSELDVHVEKKHGVKVVHKNLSFASMEEFHDWLRSMQVDATASFIRGRGTRKYPSGVKTEHYFCNRSGIPRVVVPPGCEGDRKRQLKFNGYRKIGSTCPARLTTKTKEDGSAVFVDFCETHFGHDNELKHLPIPRDRKNELATRIAAKVPIEEILQEIEESSTLGQDRLITKQDLRNIAYGFGLQNEGVFHKDDATSVEAWVQQENELGDDSCVILYKPRGLVTQEYADMGLKDDDFLLAIKMKGQMEVLKRCRAGRIVMMDSTHGINAYGYELTTLMVLDDLRQGFPAAFFISNRQDFTGIKILLEHVKRRFGIIEAKTFMSDMAETFFNAWNCVMGPCQYRLFCSWHVIRAWQMKMNATIKDIELRKFTYAKIHTLLTEMDEEAFERMLPVVLEAFRSDRKTSVFGDYFMNNYVRNRKQWAYCHRKDAGLNTNMHLERLHGAIKYMFLKGKTVKRLDLAIIALKKLVRRKIFERIQMLEKGRVTYSMRELRKRHGASLTMSFDNIVQGRDDSWSVLSEHCSDTYNVKRVEHTECGLPPGLPCQLQCQLCNICFHQFTCSCLDYRIHNTICKHVHLVCRYLKSNNISPAGDALPRASSSHQIQAEAAVLLNSLRPEPAQPKNPTEDFEIRKRDFQKRMSELLQEVFENIETSEQISAVEKHLRKTGLISLAAKRNKTFFKRVQNIATTKKIEVQRKKFEVKRKRLNRRCHSNTKHVKNKNTLVLCLHFRKEL